MGLNWSSQLQGNNQEKATLLHKVNVFFQIPKKGFNTMEFCCMLPTKNLSSH